MRIFELKGLGLGQRQVAKLAGLSRQVIVDISKGRCAKIEADTEARILGIVRPSLAHGQRIIGWREWRYLDALRKEGFTRSELARRLGYHTPKLQIGRRMTVRNALRVRALWKKVNE